LHERYIENAAEKLGAAKYLFEGGFYNDAASIESRISEEEAESIVEDAERFLVRIKKAIDEMPKSRI